jgi:hypothetical protein
MEEGCSWPRASAASSGCVASRSSMGGGTARVALGNAGAWRDIGRLRQPPPTACAGAWAPGGGAGPSDPTEKAGSWASFSSPAPPFPSGCRLFSVMETGDGGRSAPETKAEGKTKVQASVEWISGVVTASSFLFILTESPQIGLLENGRG